MNAQSIVNKVDLLQIHASEYEPDIIVITESWTHLGPDPITDEVLKIKGYDLIGRRDRKDTKNGRGGGLLLYSKLPNIYVNSVNISDKIIHATITSNDKNSEDIQIHCIYRSPNSTFDMNQEIIEYIKRIPYNSILVGDFNYPSIDWSTLTCVKPEDQEFLDTVNEKFLSQHVNFSTNFTPQPDGSTTCTCIDLVLTNEDNLIASVKPIDQLGTSHHTSIQVEIIIPSNTNSTNELVPDYSKANFDVIREKMGVIDWETCFNNLNAEESWNLFKDRLTRTIDECIPKKRRRNNSKPLWMQRNIIRIIRKKRRLWKQYTSSREYQSYLAYKRVQRETKSAVRKAKKEFEKKLASDVKKNPKAFYSYISNRCKVKAKVGPLKNENGRFRQMT